MEELDQIQGHRQTCDKLKPHTWKLNSLVWEFSFISKKPIPKFDMEIGFLSTPFSQIILVIYLEFFPYAFTII